MNNNKKTHKSRVLLTAVIALLLAGCSQVLETSYPSLANIVKMPDFTLTPKQQKQEIQKLSKEQESHKAQALKEIQK